MQRETDYELQTERMQAYDFSHFLTHCFFSKQTSSVGDEGFQRLQRTDIKASMVK
jgi:hypothetical protein